MANASWNCLGFNDWAWSAYRKYFMGGRHRLKTLYLLYFKNILAFVFFSNDYLFTYFCFWDGVLLCGSGWSAVARSWLTATSAPWVQAILLLQPPNSWDHRQAPPRLANFCIYFLVEIGQAGFELLTSHVPPTLASQSAGFTGASFCTWPWSIIS